MSNHKRWTHISPKGSDSYVAMQKKLKKLTVEHFKKEIICPECKKTFIVEVTDSQYKNGVYRHYCSRRCANKQGSKSVDYSKISKFQKEHLSGCFSTEWKLAHPTSPCSRKNFSKRELEIVKFLKETFPADEWKQGFIDGTRKHDGFILSPDCHSDKLKVVIEYDGVWHFKDIHNQLERKQSVDRAMLKFCKENGYRLIRIDESLKISNETIQDAIYNSNKDIELFNSCRYEYLFK